MKFPHWMTLLVLVLLGGAVFAQDKKEEAKPAEAKPPEKSIFPDKQLEAAVRQQVFAKRDSDAPIVAADVERLSVLKGKGMGIKDLTGLEHCKALASIELPGNELVIVGPLKDLKKVQLLDLADNKIADIAALGTMAGLQYLNLDNNQVKSLEPLKGLERLRSFYASANQIADLTPLFGIPRLHTIHANDNQIKSIAGINAAKRLDSLGLRGNQISDLKPLVGLTGLMYHLFLEGNQIKDLGPLLELCKADLEGEKRFAPYLKIYLKGNPLDENGKKQLAEMKKLKLRVQDL